MASRDPIFIHAWWRSGSTYVWSKLRENQSCRCYYEPLHEQIAGLNVAAIEGPPDLKASRALRHPTPDKNYFAEYADPLRSGRLHYSSDLAYGQYLLRPGQEAEALRNYLDGLISSASAAGRRAILCFCRSQMRSGWIKETFSGIHVAQIRNPADQWASFKIDPYFATNMTIIALNLRKSYPLAFAHIEQFESFAQQLSKRPSMPAELLGRYFIPQFVRQRDCLDLFLVIWIASAMQALACCDFVLDIDVLSTDASSRNDASQWFGSIDCRADFSDCASPISSEMHVQSPPFKQAVEDAARAVRSGAASLVVADPKAVGKWLGSLSPLSRSVLTLALEGEWFPLR